MVLSFGEVLMDCLPDKNVIGGAPLNVVVHLKRLGEEAAIISRVGDDSFGKEIYSFVSNEGLNQFVQEDENRKTGYVSVKLNNGQPSYTIHTDTAWDYIDFLKVNQIPEYFVFGTLAMHSEFNRNSFKKFVEGFSDSTFVCDLNLRQPLFNKETILFCLENADVLKINDEEFDLVSKMLKTDALLELLSDQFSIDKVLLTKGKDGADLYWEGDKYSVNVAPVNNMKDTVGAGDSFTALFLYGLIQNKPKQEILEAASRFASGICEINGAIPQDKSIYEAFK